jgi:hypothetical protein
MACSECGVTSDAGAIAAARRAGIKFNLFGVVTYTPEQLQFIADYDRAEAAVPPEGNNHEC